MKHNIHLRLQDTMSYSQMLVHVYPYRCEAAALPPRRTAAAGLLLTAALLGHCFSERAAHRTSRSVTEAASH